VERAEPRDGRVEPLERLAADGGRELPAVAPGEGRFVQDQAAAGLADRAHDRGHVPRQQRAQVDDLERPGDPDAVRDDGGVPAFARDPRLADRERVVALWHWAARRAVEQLVLEVE